MEKVRSTCLIRVPEKEYRFEEAIFDATKPNNFMHMMKYINPQTQEVCSLSKWLKRKPHAGPLR